MIYTIENRDKLRTFLRSEIFHDATIKVFQYDYNKNSIYMIVSNSYIREEVEVICNNVFILTTANFYGLGKVSRQEINCIYCDDMDLYDIIPKAFISESVSTNWTKYKDLILQIHVDFSTANSLYILCDSVEIIS